MRIVSFVAVLLVAATAVVDGKCSFTIENDRFVRDGQAFNVMAGCFHYARVVPELWEDRLSRLRAMGLNAIQTYVPWNWHNAEKGVYNFDGGADLVKFIELAAKHDLLVLLRAGPYMCGEWEFGGFPAWLLAEDPPVTLRTFESGYIQQVDAWWNTLLPKVKPLLYSNGGPVVMVQVENEFGSYGNVLSNPSDKKYMEHLVQLARANLGEDVIIYTTDGGNLGYMSRGSLNGSAVYSVGDFGPGSDQTVSFEAQRVMNAPGMSPPMCSEFYSGWLTHWGENMANHSTASLTQGLTQLLEANASFSMYMGYGGTNYGFYSGANGDGGSSYTPHITSYDYNSPISEGGQHGYGSSGQDKYAGVLKVLSQYVQPGTSAPPQEPPAPTFFAVNLTLTGAAPLFSALATLSTGTVSVPAPCATEPLGQNYGFTLFSSTAPSAGSAQVSITNVRDRAQLFVDGSLAGTTYRVSPTPVNVTNVQAGAKINVLVENMGRINFGHGMTDPKGILGPVTWNQKNMSSWTATLLPLKPEDVAKLTYSAPSVNMTTPTFFRGTFSAPSNASTYFYTPGWSKGLVWVNNFNLGRYWTAQGPQETLYIPAGVVKPGQNEIVVFELEQAPSDFLVQLVTTPLFGKPPCDPGVSAAVDQNVVLFNSSTTYAANQQWTMVGSQILLKSNMGLCLSAGPNKDPSTGNPGATLVKCDKTATARSWTRTSSGTIVNGNGMCLDVSNHDVSPRASIEIYQCNGGDNQKFSILGDGTVATDQQGASNLVLTVCSV